MKRNKFSQTKDVLTESLPGCQWKQSLKKKVGERDKDTDPPVGP